MDSHVYFIAKLMKKLDMATLFKEIFVIFKNKHYLCERLE